jgi:hypothetical protein
MPPALVRMNSTMLRDTHCIRHTGRECQYGEFHAQHPFHPCEQHPTDPTKACIESSDCCSEHNDRCPVDTLEVPCEIVSVSSCNAEEITVSVSLEETCPEQTEGGVQELSPESNPVARLSSIVAPVVNPLASGVADPRRFLV